MCSGADDGSRIYDEVIRLVAEPELIQTCHSRRIGFEKDTCAFRGAYQANHDDSEDKTTWKIFSSHQGNPSKWNQTIISSHERDMQFSSRVFPNIPDLDQHALFGVLRPKQMELSYKPAYYIILRHHRITESWNFIKRSSGLEDIDFLTRRLLDMPYLRPFGFGRLQTYLWRPGDILNQLEDLDTLLGCTITHRIRRILSHLQVPYIDPNLPCLPSLELFVFKLQQPYFHQSCCILEVPYIINNVPRHPTFGPKLSRLKDHQLALFG